MKKWHTKHCPLNITITVNSIISLKEPVVDKYYYPVKMLFQKGKPIKKE